MFIFKDLAKLIGYIGRRVSIFKFQNKQDTVIEDLNLFFCSYVVITIGDMFDVKWSENIFHIFINTNLDVVNRNSIKWN